MSAGRQIRAARGLLKWSAQALADKAGLTRDTINKIEDDAVQPREGTMNDIRRAFDENGVEFTDNSGVRLKPQGVEVLEGKEGFARFYDFVYEYLRDFGGNVYISGVDEALYDKYHGAAAKPHIERMAKLYKERDDIKTHILVEEGDYNFTASQYAEYRWQPKEFFSPASFYVFGDRLALISFDNDPAPLVIYVKSASLAEAYKHSFKMAWNQAITPKEKEEK